MSGWRAALLGCYVARGALSEGDFALRGGGRSNFYIDGRRVTTCASGLRAITAGIRENVDKNRLLVPGTTIVAPVVSGIPVATALALELGSSFVMDRGAPKAHGLGRRFEGVFEDGQECLIVDDLITVGTTVVQTVQGLREAGKLVSNVITVVDREEGGRDVLSDAGVTLYSLVTQSELRDALRAHLGLSAQD